MHYRNLLFAGAVALCLAPVATAFESDDEEIAAYRLTIDVARKVDRVNRAIAKAFAESGEEDPELFDEESTLDELEATLRDHPISSAALKSAGLGAREYARFLICWVQTAMIAGLMKDGLLPERPPEVSAENIRFLEEHAEELKAMSEGWEE